MTIEDVLKIAQLSKLEFSNEELSAFIDKFAVMDKSIEKITEIDLKGVEYQIPLKEFADLKEDEVVQSYSRAEILKNAPNKDSISFILPKVVD